MTPETRVGVAAVGVRGKVGVTTYDLPGVYINSRINNASPLNLLLPFYISDVGTLPCICRCNTFVQLWEPTNRTSSSWGGGYTVSVLVASCGPRDALTYSRRAFPASMTKVSNEYHCPLREGDLPPWFRALRGMVILRLTSRVALTCAP